MTTLIHPTNRQPCAFVEYSRGHIALRLTCTVTPAVQWFTLAQIEACNPVHTCEHDPRLTGMVYDQPQPVLTVVLTPEMAASVNASAGVEIVVRKPAPTLWHSTMKEAA